MTTVIVVGAVDHVVVGEDVAVGAEQHARAAAACPRLPSTSSWTMAGRTRSAMLDDVAGLLPSPAARLARDRQAASRSTDRCGDACGPRSRQPTAMSPVVSSELMSPDRTAMASTPGLAAARREQAEPRRVGRLLATSEGWRQSRSSGGRSGPNGRVVVEAVVLLHDVEHNDGLSGFSIGTPVAGRRL